jgi:two-component system phosphate regulon sensor histidine kinase PhoR
MFPSRRLLTDLPSATLALLCVGLGAAWVVEPALAPVSWPVRLTVLVAGCVMAATAWRVGSQRHNQELKAAHRYLDLLCRLDLHRSSESGAGDSVPTLSAGHPWRNLFDRVRETLSTYSSKLEEAELARAAAEVRARRATSERDQLTEIISGLADPVLAVGPFGELLHANNAAIKLLGLNIGRGAAPLIDQLAPHMDVNNLLTDARRRKMASARTAEILLSDTMGRQQWFRTSVRTLLQAGEAEATGERASMHGAMLVLSDISAHKAMQQRNAEFVSAASHEMKTPLSSIRAYVELLADGEAEDEQTRDEFFEVIQTQAERLQRLIDNLLNLARIEAGVVAVQKQARSLNELLQEAANVVQPSAEAKLISLNTEFSPLYLGVFGDRDTLLQAAINLLSNAIKYTPQGGTVTFRSRLSGDEVVFEVSDTGVGLSEEDCQKVFERFYRVKKDQQMAPGTGLGLPLVKHIVEDIHAGRIEVASELGKGSTFGVVLPGLGQLSA